ncbi:hypothetical protein BWR17_19490 (plasmid) [Phaeobacter inhibens]|nr:hypothetical protein BWR17_19490 [Phaeobacter inhibens]
MRRLGDPRWRARSAVYRHHIKVARFPAYQDLSGFEFASNEVNEALLRQLHRSEFLAGAQNIVLIDGSGTGKSHIATAIRVQAIEHHRKKVHFFSTVDLMILDELSNLPFGASGGALLFQLLSKL